MANTAEITLDLHLSPTQSETTKSSELQDSPSPLLRQSSIDVNEAHDNDQLSSSSELTPNSQSSLPQEGNGSQLLVAGEATEEEVQAQQKALGCQYWHGRKEAPRKIKEENIDQAKARLKSDEILVLREDIIETTDFTLVKHLFINKDYRNVESFIDAGFAKDLSTVESLVVDIRDVEEEDKSRFRKPLSKIFSNLRSLQSLVVRAEEFQFSLFIATICKTGATLRSLELEGESRSSGRDPVSLNDLKELLEYCPDLEHLKIYLPMFPYDDIDGYVDRLTFEADKFLCLIGGFQKLETLHLLAQHSLGTLEPTKAESSDPDYEDMLLTMGIPFVTNRSGSLKKVTITLDRAFMPRHWRFDYEKYKFNKHSSNPRDYWPRTRQMSLRRISEDKYDLKVELGSGFVKEIKDGSVDPNETETYEEYLERSGDGKEKRVRDKHWQIPVPRGEED